MSTALSLSGPSPARVRAGDAGEHGGQPVAAGQPGEVLAVDRVERDVDARRARPSTSRVAPCRARCRSSSSTIGMPGAAADDSAMISTRSPRVSGSPPVKRTSWTPRSRPAMPTSRAISAAVSRSSRGIAGRPSAGMQYVQRSEHFSVTETRRSRATRPKRVDRARRCPGVRSCRRRARRIAADRGIPSESVDMSASAYGARPRATPMRDGMRDYGDSGGARLS